MYTHRALSDADLHSICSFPQTAEELFYIGPKFVFPLTPDQITSLLANRFEPTVVIEEGTGNVAAYANLYDRNEQTCWLGNVIVSPEYRGRGAAEYLLNTMMRKASQLHGMHKLTLYCHNTNSRGLAFYHKHGFKPVDIRITATDAGKSIISIQMEKALV
ncbi:GNAT family N-acetyltransferase [Paenibacillus sp. H1-7]|nr:GNAT family N-acetyltransferase [Paenibacillus sp. H1-7]